MSEIDDRTLIRADGLGHTRGARIPASSKIPIVVIATLGLILGGIGAWWWTREPARSPQQATGATGTEAAVPPATEPARPLPPIGQMDTFLRALLGGLSSSPELARWLATDDLIQQMANGIDRVSRGQSPARDVPVLKPGGTFGTSGLSQRATIDPASFRRYDGLALMVSSLDARSVASAYRTIQPRLDEAYRGLGRSEGSVDQAVSVALQILIDTPVVREPMRVVPGTGATYAYADPSLEKLTAAQKQLLRMGPDNLARIRERLQEIKLAIETTTPR
jgi:hypothetical protein